MPYITSIERLAKEEGKEEGSLETAREAVITVLDARFGTIPSPLSEVLNQIEDLPRLKQLHKRAITLASVEEFEQLLTSGQTQS